MQLAAVNPGVTPQSLPPGASLRPGALACGLCGICPEDAPMMSWAGSGLGEYRAVTTYQYVGKGYGDFSEIEPEGWQQRHGSGSWSCGFGLVGLAALLGLLTWLFLRSVGGAHSSAAPPPVPSGRKLSDRGGWLASLLLLG
mmetsp:Transcript_103311/g.287583  ORF Transcript_103311/g.287583 Transcript_103311/m.287583 type:complete len:141 (+) Transcript_103311:93-515(+)|eukprot:CAMPEP_0179074524 /NCGR_PEP_ID=MMETSP0796-20121207/33130_1 /TAXON_ID=73915 /ORGANISM="Pyrodinium bahamense, Strain pbaha01" /LENGTH=140 /DNA_ID=CAMNT_0020771749 /DNA_START=83 /DNA_END=505 /DNA_ORIENTATION=-